MIAKFVRMTRLLSLSTLTAGLLTACSVDSVAPVSPTTVGLIPAPATLEHGIGEVQISARTFIVAVTPAERRVAEYLSLQIEQASGHRLAITDTATKPAIRLEFNESPNTLDESYTLSVNAEGMRVSATSESGLFYGAVSAWQILTPWPAQNEELDVPFMEITDHPAYPWRGVLLDSARHMQSTEYIKTFIDWMALHKLNTLHWHLTDDQGWRIEIQAYPELTRRGAWRVPAGRAAQKDIDELTGEPRRYGGYYTQDEIRDVVAYAQSRHVTIVPEIDVPGHALAAIVAYPELGVVEAPDQVMSDWGVYPYLFSPEDSTFEFLDTVLAEVATLFPGEYIHVGGDEAPKHQWRGSERVQALMTKRGIENEDLLQGYFTARLEQILAKYDRRLVGWDEIVEGGLGEDAIVMSWRGLDGAIEAAAHGHQAIISPNSHLYLDYRQSDLGDEPPGRGRQITLRDVYEFDFLANAPDPDALQRSVLGLQANLWTEHMRTEARVTHMAFPRLAALAELAWHAPVERDYEEFAQRSARMLTRYTSIGLPYADSLVQPVMHIDWTESSDTDAKVTLTSQTEIGQIRYTLDGSDVDLGSPAFESALTVPWGTHLRAAQFFNGAQVSGQIDWQIDPMSRFSFEDTDLATCQEMLVLHLEDDAPVRGDRPNFQVDIMDPCWTISGIDLSEIGEIELTLGQVPYNFQLMDDINNVVVYPAPASGPAITVHADTCEAPAIGLVRLPGDSENDTLVTVRADLRTSETGVTDLCFRAGSGTLDPLWVIESGRFIPANAGTEE